MEGRLVQGESFLQGGPAAFKWFPLLICNNSGDLGHGNPTAQGFFFCPQNITIEVLLGQPVGS